MARTRRTLILNAITPTCPICHVPVDYQGQHALCASYRAYRCSRCGRTYSFEPYPEPRRENRWLTDDGRPFVAFVPGDYIGTADADAQVLAVNECDGFTTFDVLRMDTGDIERERLLV